MKVYSLQELKHRWSWRPRALKPKERRGTGNRSTGALQVITFHFSFLQHRTFHFQGKHQHFLPAHLNPTLAWLSNRLTLRWRHCWENLPATKSKKPITAVRQGMCTNESSAKMLCSCMFASSAPTM